MPFRHKDVPFLSQFRGLQLLRQDGSTIPASEAFKGKRYVLIYFSAHWCPPCQRFTPLLADFYDEHKDRCEFEVLFVSSDREEGRMMDFFQNRSSNYVRRPASLESANGCGAAAAAPPSPPPPPASQQFEGEPPMGCDISSSRNTTPSSSPVVGAGTGPMMFPSGCTLKPRVLGESRAAAGAGGPRIPKASGHGSWLALPFKETDVARFLSRSYSVVSIPKLVVVAVDTSCMVTREGKAMVLKDPDAAKFPWRFAEGTMTAKHEGRRECIALLLLFLAVLYYYYW
jgi:thiol-disulfide isomerase/thioredoxin